MGTVGNCYRDSPMESFWESMQIELLNRENSKTVVELPSATAEWIDALSRYVGDRRARWAFPTDHSQPQ
jgi:hypothetical protein